MYVRVKPDAYGPLHRLEPARFIWSGAGTIPSGFALIESSAYAIHGKAVAEFCVGYPGVAATPVTVQDGSSLLHGYTMTVPLISYAQQGVGLHPVFAFDIAPSTVLVAGRLIVELEKLVGMARIDDEPVLFGG